jgi:hypothetical protein
MEDGSSRRLSSRLAEMGNHSAAWHVALALGTACTAGKQVQDGQIVVEPLAVAEPPKTSDGGPPQPSDERAVPAQHAEALDDTLNVALRRGAERAARCSVGIPGAPTGEGDVHVFVDGQKGRIADAIVGAPFARTAVERCIVNAFIGEIVVPFEGPPKEIAIKVKVVPR